MRKIPKVNSKFKNKVKKQTLIPASGKGSPWRGYLIYGVMALLLFMVFFNFSGSGVAGEKITLSQALSDIKEDKVKNVLVDGDKVNLTYKDGAEKLAQKEKNESLVETFSASSIDPSKISYEVKDNSTSELISSVLINFLPIIVIIVVFFLIFRQAREGANSVFSFGQSKAKRFSKDNPTATFKDVAGVDEAKKELEEVVEFLKNPKKFTALGAKTPKGVLLVGPAGTGKTLLARAVAGEAGVPFFSVAGSEFMEMLVGVGAARVRDLFANAKASGSAIIFIDEIESIGRQRGMSMSGGHDEREQTLNQILVEMDGFNPNDNVIVMAATNRPDLLDPALVRPGRFDRTVVLSLPDIEERKAILSIHKTGKPFVKNVDWTKIAKRTVGFSGADLANMLNEAAILTAREGKKEITSLQLEEAATKVKMGPQKKRLQSQEEKEMTAYHEGGHAIVAHFSPNMDPVHRISIVSRGMTGGHTLIPPSVDRTTEKKSHLLEQIATLLGGRAAEELVYGEVSTGASNDLSVATNIARQMVTEFGMSNLGAINVGGQKDFGVWGVDSGPGYSEEFAAKIDKEIVRILDEGYKDAVVLLKKNKKVLDLVVKRLVEVETMESEEFEKIAGPRPMVAKKVEASKSLS